MTQTPHTSQSSPLQARIDAVTAKIIAAAERTGRDPEDVKLIAVSKTFDGSHIEPVIKLGMRVFGENRVQEAQGKWPELKSRYPDVELHLIGPLQSNKARDAVELFDCIHTIDRPKIASAIAAEMARQNRKPKLLVQVNTGEEEQKSGVLPGDVDDFLALCRDQHGLEISGLMCIPPLHEEPSLHFALLNKIAKRNNCQELSMGMSADYESAVALGATYVRVGTAIFGTRD